jgi:hypothetical protein
MSYQGDKNQAGQPHGKGKYNWPTGDSYEGDWNNGQITGKGIYRFHNGSAYDGDFVQAKKHGKGTWIADFGYQQGEFRNDHFVQGTTWYYNGNKHEGYWEGGDFQGQGCFYDAASNSYFYGNFNRGNRVSGFWLRDGNHFRGDFTNGQFSSGIYTWPDGHSKQCRFINGQMDQKSAVKLEDHIPEWPMPKTFYNSTPWPSKLITKPPPNLPVPTLPATGTVGSGGHTVEPAKVGAAKAAFQNQSSSPASKPQSVTTAKGPSSANRGPPAVSHQPPAPKPTPAAPAHRGPPAVSHQPPAHHQPPPAVHSPPSSYKNRSSSSSSSDDRKKIFLLPPSQTSHSIYI